MNYLPIIDKISRETSHTAIIDAKGSYTYQELLERCLQIASFLQQIPSFAPEARINFLIQPSFAYTSVLLGVWQAGGIAVPMCVSHPLAEWEYVLEDTQCKILIADSVYYEKVKPLCQKKNIALFLYEDIDAEIKTALPAVPEQQRALMIYTSGTTGKPKGVVTTHANIQCQITTLTEAWQWQASDKILHVLPLHHVHGIINVLACALWSNASCHFVEKLDAENVWDCFLKNNYTLFMAVPTIYNRLIEVFDGAALGMQKEMKKVSNQMRLMVSGSAALPISTLEKWKKITGHTLLERYGMTEIGMALSNPYEGVRLAGHVGFPLPNVHIRLADSDQKEVAKGEAGEIQVKGENVFLEYWQRPEATQAAFIDGWFATGDIAQQNEQGYFRILGRNSVDIIKTGGYKVSALEIEEVLRKHPAIKECAVVGIEDIEWGEKVSVAMEAYENLSLEDLRRWAKPQLAIYKVPQALLLVDALPRNAMGKVMKPQVKALFQANL